MSLGQIKAASSSSSSKFHMLPCYQTYPQFKPKPAESLFFCCCCCLSFPKEIHLLFGINRGRGGNKGIISFLTKWTPMYAYGWKHWRSRKHKTVVYLALLSHWFWLGKQALVLGHVVWFHPKSKGELEFLLGCTETRGQARGDPCHNADKKESRTEGKNGLIWRKQNALTHSCRPPTILSLPLSRPVPPSSGTLSKCVCGWKGQGPAAVQSNKSCHSVNHMCQQGHFYLRYTATAALPDETFASLMDRAIYHGADSSANANNPLREEGLNPPGASQRNGWSVSWQCGGSAHPAAWAVTHSSRVLVMVAKVTWSLQATWYGDCKWWIKRGKLT